MIAEGGLAQEDPACCRKRPSARPRRALRGCTSACISPPRSSSFAGPLAPPCLSWRSQRCSNRAGARAEGRPAGVRCLFPAMHEYEMAGRRRRCPGRTLTMLHQRPSASAERRRKSMDMAWQDGDEYERAPGPADGWLTARGRAAGQDGRVRAAVGLQGEQAAAGDKGRSRYGQALGKDKVRESARPPSQRHRVPRRTSSGIDRAETLRARRPGK